MIVIIALANISVMSHNYSSAFCIIFKKNLLLFSDYRGDICHRNLSNFREA